MYETRYHRPGSLGEAAALFAEAAEGRYLSGGQTLIPTMKQRLAAPTDIIDLSAIAELKGIEATGDAVSIGAAATHAEVHASEAVRQAIPALADLAGMIGDPAVREMGTIGGSLANNDPAADYPAAVLALGATVHTSRRSLAADDFFAGLFATALDEGEIVTRVTVPGAGRGRLCQVPQPGLALCHGRRLRRPHEGRRHPRRRHRRRRQRRLSLRAMEQALARSWSPAAIDAVAIDPAGMLSDIHASAAYRANLVKVMARRAVAAIG